MSRPIQRILLCSMAVPWPQKPLLCAFHHDQARALRELGVEMRLFSPAPKVPALAAALHRRLRGHYERPSRYEMNGVVTESPRCAFAFSPFIRHQAAAHCPEGVAGWASKAMRHSLRDAIDRFQPDLLLGHGVMPWGALLHRMQRETEVPFALIEHSAGDVTRLASGTRLEQHCARVAAQARAVFVVGSWMRSHLERLGWNNVRQLVNGARAPDQVQRRRDRPSDLAGRTIVLSAGSPYRRKGFEELVDGFARIAHRHPDAVLVVVTDATRSVRRRVRRAALGDRIRVLPMMSQQNLMQWMVWADLFALPSWSEAFGLVYVEALAGSTPVLMSTDCGLADQLDMVRTQPSSAQHGWTVQPRCVDAVSTALRDALSDPARLAAMGCAGREFALRRFTWQDHATQLLAGLHADAVRPGGVACL